MKLLDWDQVLKELYEQRDLDGYDPYNLEFREVFAGLENCFDKESAKGWNVFCFIDDPIVPNRYGFLFEESKTVYKYKVVFLDEITEKAYAEWRHKGVEYSNDKIAEVLEENNILLPMYIPSLRYTEDAEGNFMTLPIYVTREVAGAVTKVDVKTLTLYDEYQKETKKNAIYHGKVTKGFKAWLSAKEAK